MSIYPTLHSEPIAFKKATASTGNVMAYPQTQLLAPGEYSVAIGAGGMPLDIRIRNADAGLSVSGVSDVVTLETSSDQSFAGTPVVNAEFGQIPFESIPVDGSVTARNIELAGDFVRVNNTSAVDIEVDVWYKPNRS